MKKLFAMVLATSMCILMMGCGQSVESNVTTDLISFMGQPIADVCKAIPELEKDGNQYSATTEKSTDGISLAGPFIDIDAKENVTGITYGGAKYCIDTVWTGTSMEEAGKLIKERGWTFQSVDFAHGTAQYVVTYTKDNMELVLVSDESGDFSKSEESDVIGCVATISINIVV